MKPYLFIILLSFFATNSRAAFKSITDTVKNVVTASRKRAVEQSASYPGGLSGFIKYITKNIKYPEVARLLSINDKVYVSFIIDKNGQVINVIPIKCKGAGYDVAVVDVIQHSKHWQPGMQNGKPVRVQLTIPVNFIIKNSDGYVNINKLRKSKYGFIFQINGNIYTLDEAEVILGKKFQSDQIEEAIPYQASEKYQTLDKKAVYILVIKS